MILYLTRKIPYKLSSSRKRGIRERLKNVQSVLNLLNSKSKHFFSPGYRTLKSTAEKLLRPAFQLAHDNNTLKRV